MSNPRAADSIEKQVPDEDAPIVVSCPDCGRVLFEGTQRQARRLIIYCVECATR